MANEILNVAEATSSLSSFVFYVSGDFSPAQTPTNYVTGLSSPTGVVLTLSALADAGGAMSAKVDLGVRRADEYTLLGCVDYTGETPTAGSVDYYWAPSTSATSAIGNTGGISGSGALTGYSANSVAELVALMDFIGSLTVSNDAVVINSTIGRYSPPTRWGQLVVVNNGNAPFEADNVEHHQVLIPITPEVQ